MGSKPTVLVAFHCEPCAMLESLQRCSWEIASLSVALWSRDCDSQPANFLLSGLSSQLL